MLILLNTGNPLKTTLASSEDPDEMLHNAAFHQGLHCLLGIKHSSGTVVHLNLEISTCDPLICRMNHPRINVSNPMKE